MSREQVTSVLAYTLTLALGVLAGVWLTGCQLGPRGQAAVAAQAAIRALDSACALASSGTDAAVADAVTACSPVPDPVRCYDGRMAGRQKALSACAAYGAARSSDVAQGAARAALSAIGGAP